MLNELFKELSSKRKEKCAALLLRKEIGDTLCAGASTLLCLGGFPYTGLWFSKCFDCLGKREKRVIQGYSGLVASGLSYEY